MKFCARTDKGLKRKKNEDAYLTVTGEDTGFPINVVGCVFAVADGMGGHPAGDIAADMACTEFRDIYYNIAGIEKVACSAVSALIPSLGCRMLLHRAKKAIGSADRKIRRYECDHTKCEGLGTTLSVLIIKDRWALIAHVGDSRIYRLRNGKLKLLTVDHTFVQDLVDMGEITRDEADESPMRHVLMQALGQGIEEVYTHCERVRPRDLFLACSDGLHDMISDNEIAGVLSAGISIKEKCGRLIEKALEAGGRDNITVIAAQYG